MKEPRIFILTLLALRTDIDNSQLNGAAGASTILTVQTSSEAAEAEGWQHVHDRYPQTDGWFGHQVNAFELPDSIETDGYRVSLDIMKIGGQA